MTSLALLIGSAFSLLWVDPYGPKPYLPDSPPEGGVETNVLALAAAQGEIEVVSFSVKPVRDMRKVDFTPSDLTGPSGATIPASCSDFALVKVWYRADTRWWNNWAGGVNRPTLVNNLILHDDDVVRVVESEDVAKRTNLIKISYPEGDAYVDMRKHGGEGHPFNADMHPVIDAKKFVPFDLKEGRYQQYWFTWKVPGNAAPGIYKGSLAVSEEGKHLADIPVELEVYPFRLPTARTHYDTSRPYVSMWMGVPNLATSLKGSKRMEVAERKTRAIYRSCAEHNAHCQGPGGFKANSTDDLAVRSLLMMRQEGMRCDLFVNGTAYETSYMGAGPIMDDFKTPEEDFERFAEATNAFTRKVALTAEIMDKYLGHRNCYFHSLDECGSYFNRLSYPFWGILNKYGFQAWTDSGVAKDISWSVGMNDIPACLRHEECWAWHKAGARTVTYAGPFTGPICPDIWRRTKGVRYYYSDFDGLDEYCFYTCDNEWNDFYASSPYSQFQFVYLTYDGLISTLAWEGVREALDDVRYLSLLRMRAEAAMESPDKAVRDLGRKNILWMDAQDPELVIDLHAFRREVARRAMELIAVVGPQPPDPEPRPAPETLPPLSDDIAPMPPPAERSARAAKLARANRYDLAIPMYESVRTNLDLAPQIRFDAAVEEAGLLSEILKRDRAIEILDGTAKMPDLKNFQRTRLLLLGARLLMTSRVFEEEFTKEQLDEAAAIVARALQLPGATEEERYEAVMRLARAYRAGFDNKAAIDFIEARLADVKLEPRMKQELRFVEAQAYVDLEDWDNAAAMFRQARHLGMVRKRDMVKMEGMVAEKRKDWKTAVVCYSDESRMYSDEEKAQRKWCLARLDKVMTKLDAQTRSKGVTDIDDIDDGTKLKLDE